MSTIRKLTISTCKKRVIIFHLYDFKKTKKAMGFSAKKPKSTLSTVQYINIAMILLYLQKEYLHEKDKVLELSWVAAKVTGP